VAVLVRSATPFSLNTPHTGGMEPARIPAAAITVEDADYLDRMYHRYLTAHNSTSHYKDLFVQPTVTLTMNAQTIHNQLSQNIILELKGRELTDEIVLAGGHIDSWDVGMGVLDNGAGFFTAWHALRVIAQLTTPPRRTVRIVGWTDEEKGGAGARAYFANHQHELPQHVLAIESDAGIFQPWGLEFSGEPAAATRLMEIGRKYLGEHGAGNVTTVNGPVGADTALLCREHVPCAGFLSLDPLTHEPPTKSNNYFYYHHTMADTLNAIHSKDVSASVASMASWLYLVAEQDDNLRQM
jgi:carboxypeptidase Q